MIFSTSQLFQLFLSETACSGRIEARIRACQRDEAKRIRKNFRRYSEYLLRTEGEIDCLGMSFETFEYLESLELLDLEALDSTGEKKWVSLS